MYKKGFHRPPLPLQVVVIMLIAIGLQIGFTHVLYSYYARTSVNPDLLREFWVLTLVCIFTVGAGSIYLIHHICDVMYNRDQLTLVANAYKAAAFAMKKQILRQLPNYTSVFINLVNFSYINNTVGAKNGDIVLHLYAKAIFDKLGRKNFVGRLGGDNFIVYVKNDEYYEFVKFAKEIPITIDYNGMQKTFNVCARMGVYRPTAGDNHGLVLNCTSLAVDVSKKNQNVITIFEPWMQETFIKEKKFLEDFDRADFDNDFEVHYQPKYSYKTKSICGAEALVTWTVDGKHMNPEEYIPLLEETSKVIDLDFYMLKCVCQDISAWMEKGIKVLPISINFSKSHFADMNFAKQVLATINEYNVPTKYIEIEITETFIFDESAVMREIINDFQSCGIKVAMDDFGKGYSSLSLVQDMNFNTIKLDKSFVIDMQIKERKAFISQLIVMLKKLGYEVVCEGIETEEQSMLVEIAGADIAQGYYYGKNMPKSEYEALL